MSEFDQHAEVKEVLEDRDEQAKQELVTALINSIENLGKLSLSQKHQIFHAIETIIDHHVMDSEVLINEILPHVFNLLKEEVPKEEYYAVCILKRITLKCFEKRHAVLEMAEYLMEQLKTNYQLFHEELFKLVEKYGEVLGMTTVVKSEASGDTGNGGRNMIGPGMIQRKQSIILSKGIIVDESEQEKESVESQTNVLRSSSSSLLSLLPAVITRTISSSSIKNEDGGLSRSKSSSSSLLDLMLPSPSKTSTPPPDLPYEVLPDFIALLRRKTDLHNEAQKFLQMLAASSGPDFDPDHNISVFLSKFSEWNNRTKSKSSMMLRQMVKKCDSLKHVEALVETDILMELVEVLHEGSFATKSEAIWIVQSLTNQPLFHDAILDSPVLNAIIDLLQVEGNVSPISMEAFWMLENCCKEECLRDAIFQEGGMPGLIHVVKQLHLDDPEPLKVLAFLTQDTSLDTRTGHLSEKNILTHVLHALRHGTVDEQIDAQELLITLAKGVSVHHLTSAFIDADALSVLLEMLQGKHKLKVKALQILRLLAKDY
jgi:hypothetical protein